MEQGDQELILRPNAFDSLGQDVEAVFVLDYRITDIPVIEAIENVDLLSITNRAFITIIGQNDAPDIVSGSIFFLNLFRVQDFDETLSLM